MNRITEEILTLISIYADFLHPKFWVPAAIIMGLELVYPAKKRQTVFSVGLFQDFAWYVLKIFFQVILLWGLITYLNSLFQANFGQLQVHFIEELPRPFFWLFFILLTDFLGWFHHLVRHKVQPLWYFHVIHHSQRDMNIFTDHRVHVIDELVALLIKFIPMNLFGVPLITVFHFHYFSKWYTMMYHANLKLDFGFLRFILVTPQSHRVHHSAIPQHFDKNFGVLFSIWDRLFGTHCDGDFKYPITGVDDESFPYEQSVKDFAFLKNIARQFAYPFRKIYQDVRGVREQF